MRRLWVLVRREYIERVRTKAFVIGTVLGPLLMGGMTVIPGLLMSRGGKPLRVTVVDVGGQLAAPIEAALAGRELNGQKRFIIEPAGPGSAEEREKRCKEGVLTGRLDGYVVLPGDALDKSEATYYGKNVSNMVDLGLMNHAIEQTLIGLRLTEAGIPPERVKEVTHGLNMKRIRVTDTGEREDRGASTILAVVLMMILYATVLMWGQMLLTSVIEEKTSRVVEVMASAVPPFHLLVGKLLGVGAAGMTQFLVWALSLFAISLGGAGMMVAMGGGKLPEISLLLLVGLVVYFVLGFLLYSAMFAAVGASVNTSQEAQGLAFPVMMPLIASVMMVPMVMQGPDSPLSVVLSLIPFFTPLLMFLRIAVLTPPMWQIALSIVLTGLTIAGVLWVAARIYRVGILMYGKRPTFPEILRWVRRSSS
jgi:ABC-2 type transport system permease protein